MGIALIIGAAALISIATYSLCVSASPFDFEED